MELYVCVGFFTKQIFAQRDCVAIKASKGGGYLTRQHANTRKQIEMHKYFREGKVGGAGGGKELGEFPA